MFKEHELPKHNPNDEEIREIFASSKIIAVVGLSDKHDRDSYKVAAYLQEQGYWIIPVNPKIRETLGEKAYKDLKEVPEKIDVVLIFRHADVVGEIIKEALAIEAKVVWMQEGIVNNVEADRAREAGLQVVMDKCMMKEHKKMEIDTSI